jgi:hypothetical protein
MKILTEPKIGSDRYPIEEACAVIGRVTIRRPYFKTESRHMFSLSVRAHVKEERFYKNEDFNRIEFSVIWRTQGWL